MEREFVEVDADLGTDTVTVCDECGLEADHHLIPLGDTVDHLKRVERQFISALEAVDVPDVPEPVFEERHRVESDGGAAEGGWGYGMTVTASVSTAMMPVRGSGTTKNVTERHYDGVDADERELIERAEALEAKRDDLERAVRSALRAIRTVGEVSIEASVDLCEECYEWRYGWESDDE